MKVLFAVIYNLLKGDFENEEKIKKIEDTLRGVVNYCWRCDVTPKELAYSFPFDPTVTTPTIPIICDITFLPTDYLAQRDGRSQEIVENIQGALTILFEDEKRDVLVIGRDTIRNRVAFCPDQK